MRFLNALLNDVRFQMKYGFYFLYAFFCAVYIAVMMITPPEYKNMVVSLIILTDPAMLGVFFIGGIWLLEKGEGLHRFWSISPLRPMEYILSKSVSLAILSMVSSDLIVWIGMGSKVRFLFLSFCVFTGAVVFNLIGLAVASFAHSVNHYMLLVILPTVFLSIPPVLTAFGLTHPLLEIFPGTALWHMIADSIDRTRNINGLRGLVLIFWFGLLLIYVKKRICTALQSEGSGSV